MVFHGVGLRHRCELIGVVLLYATISSGMSATAGPTNEPPSTSQNLSTDEETDSTTQAWSENPFPKLGGSITMIVAAILGSLLTSWIARRACPDSWSGQYCESCRNYFTSFKGRRRKKSAIVLPADEDPTLRWTVAPGPTPFTTVTTLQQPASDISSPGGLKNGAKNSINDETKPKPRVKPSFMTVSSLVSNFTVPRTDLTSIALEQIKTDKSSTKNANKDESKETKAPTGSKDSDGVGLTNKSKESFTEDDSSLENGVIGNKADKGSVGEQEDISYDETEPLKQTQAKEVVVETHASPSKRYGNDEIMDPREAAKLDSPSQKSETYSSDFESTTTHMTHETGLYSESPIRTIYEEVKS